MSPKISVVMSIYYPDRLYLDEQLGSIAESLKYAGLEASFVGVYRADYIDKSDEIDSLFRRYGWLKSPSSGQRLGFARSYVQLIQELGANTDYLFISDQDDIWAIEKIATFIALLDKAPAETLAISNSKKFKNGEVLGPTVPPFILATAKDLLVKGRSHDAILNTAQFFYGHNIALTGAAVRSLEERLLANNKIYSHDRFLVYLAFLSGLHIIVDEGEYTLYRQHHSQVVGGIMPSGRLIKFFRHFQLYFHCLVDLSAAINGTNLRFGLRASVFFRLTNNFFLK